MFAALLAGCGVGGEAVPTRLDDFALPQESVPDEAGAEDDGPTTVVYFARGDRLEAVERSLPTTVPNAVRSLLEGPRETETNSGLRSALPTGTRLLGASVQAGVATVDLSDGFAAVVGPEQILAVAQLVYTVTSVPGVVGIRLAIEGQPVDAARGDGSLAPGAVGRSDYPGLLEG